MLVKVMRGSASTSMKMGSAAAAEAAAEVAAAAASAAAVALTADDDVEDDDKTESYTLFLVRLVAMPLPSTPEAAAATLLK